MKGSSNWLNLKGEKTDINKDISSTLELIIMKRMSLILLMMLLPWSADAQQGGAKKVEAPKEKGTPIQSSFPVQAQYSKTFKIFPYYFNKRIDPSGKGELLEVEMIFENLTDDPQDLYIFVIATYEKKEKTKSSFEIPVPESERIKNFVAFPDDIRNFQYEKDTEKGGVQLVKYPKNTKAGINPETGKAYHLDEKLLVRTFHLSPYKKKFYFFNHVTILVFDSEGKPAFRREFQLKGIRR